MKSDDVISSGNTFASTFLISFFFVYFAIIEPHFAPKGLLEQHADEALQEIDDAKKQLRTELGRIRMRHLRVGASLDESMIPNQSARLSNSHKIQAAQLQKDEREVQQIHEKTVQLDLAQQTIEKTKLEKKQYSIPLLSVSLDEETLLKLFPVLVLTALIRLLFYRSRLLNCISQYDHDFFPPWIAPLPFGRTSLPFWSWAAVNCIGLSLTGTVVLMTLRFIFSYARENFSSLGLVAIDAVLILGWTVSYAYFIGMAILGQPTQSPAQTLEPE